jgi:hypothetical protein
MPWTNKPYQVFGPYRRAVDKATPSAPANPAPLWRAVVKVHEHAAAGSPGWRHLFLDQASPPPQAHAHLPGTAVVRCAVQRLEVKLFDAAPAAAFTPSGPPPLVTLIVQTNPRDNVAPEQWSFANVAGQFELQSLPIMMCVGGEIEARTLQTAVDWRTPLAAWGASGETDFIARDSLVAHSSGLAVLARPPLLWTGRPEPARYNLLYARPRAAADDKLLIEPDRQWLFGDLPEAEAALADLRAKFRELDDVLRSSSRADDPRRAAHWVHLGLQNPAGPPQFEWLAPAAGRATFRLRPGEAVVTLTDQAPGKKDVVPRSVATVVGDVEFFRESADRFRIRTTATRELCEDLPPLTPAQEAILDARLEPWVGRLLRDQSRLRWLPGRSMSKADAAKLRADFGGEAALAACVERLVAQATLRAEIPPGLPFNFSSMPELAARTEVVPGKELRWFGVAAHGSSSGLAADDPAVAQLEARIAAGPAAERPYLQQLRRQLGAQLDYQFQPPGGAASSAESLAWSAIDATYDANDVAELLRTVHDAPRPDPDEISRQGDRGQYRVEPAMLWGTMPLETGWAMLPFFNVTDELYLRVLQPEEPLLEAALVSGAAAWGNDDSRLWATARDEQRWSLTLIDADQILGHWQFDRAGGEWSPGAARVRIYQPEVAFNGLLWLSARGPTAEDALPDVGRWPTGLRSIPLRSPRTREAYPAPYLVALPAGRMSRLDLDRKLLSDPPPLDSYAGLDAWRMEFETNPRKVHVPRTLGEHVERAPFRANAQFPLTPQRTPRLELVRRLHWPAATPITAAAIDKLKEWAADGHIAWAFRRAAARLARRLSTYGAGAHPDLFEPFAFSDGALIHETAGGWGPLFGRLKWEWALVWHGGSLDAESRALLESWRTIPSVDAALVNAIDRMLRFLAAPADEQRSAFAAIREHPFWSHQFERIDEQGQSSPRPFFPPLVWRRHPALPFIQSLPLTQSLCPPSHPSSSRQLAPYQLNYAHVHPAPVDWKFGGETQAGEPAGAAGRRWAAYLGSNPLDPAGDWTGAAPDGPRLLPMAALSLPGVSAHPASGDVAPIADPSGSPLNLQWSHGLPYLDEQYVLATAPREAGLAENPQATAEPPSAAAQAGDQRAAPRPSPLKRETFHDAWSELARLALLAAAADERGLAFASASEQRMPALVEPLAWHVNATVTQQEFPGELTFQDLHAPAPDRVVALREPLADGYAAVPPADRRRQTALRGIQGTFAQISASRIALAAFAAGDGSQFDVVAGALHARLEANGRLRDQRGLTRSPTKATADWLQTEAGGFTLWTSLQAVPLTLRGWGEWRLWFRDVPVSGAEFRRPASPANEDVNDPTAEGRTQNAQQGYEWRLADAAGGDLLRIGRFLFFPLALQRIEFAGDQVRQVEFTGRLQLALPQRPDGSAPERDQDANVVRLKFTSAGGVLTWDFGLLAEPSQPLSGPLGGTPPKSQLVWPLGPLEGAPQLRCENLALVDDGGVAKLELAEPRVDLSLFGVAWSPKVVAAKIGPGDRALAWALDVGAAAEPVGVESAPLAVDLVHGAHALAVVLKSRWGETARPHIVARKTLTLLPSPDVQVSGSLHGGGATLKLIGKHGADVDSDLPDDKRQALFAPSIQISWEHMETPPGLSANDFAFYLLPGFGVKRTADAHGAGRSLAPGYASIAFRVRGTADAEAPPAFEQAAGASELLVQCDWGLALQELRGANDGDWLPTLRAFGSSAGSASAAMITTVSGSAATTALVLSGMVEVKNLVSWPTPDAAECDAANAQFTVRKAGDDFHHWRHTARILLNQLTIEDQQLAALPPSPAGSPPILVGLKDSVQFLAVVEHQIAELVVDPPVGAGRAPQVNAIAREFRWSASQEVRLMTPAAVAAAWRRFRPGAAPEPYTVDTARDNRGRVRQVRQVASGWLRDGLLATMLGGDSHGIQALGAATIVVELSAAFYLARRSRAARTLAADNDFVNVQVLPGGIDQAIATDVSDVIPPNPDAAGDKFPWSIAVAPFVGRLQPANLDGLRGASDPVAFDPQASLRVDPVLWLAAPAGSPRPPYVFDLTSRSESSVSVVFAEFDRVVEQRWRSVDAASLETAWHRLLTPPPEPESAAPGTAADQPLHSIMAALAPGGVARLSRRASLDQLFDPDLSAYPPTRESTRKVDGLPMEWRYGALLALHAGILGTAPEKHSFVAAGKRLAQILGSQPATGLQRVAALTLTPPKLRAENLSAPPWEVKLRQDVSFVPSPYFALRRESLPPPIAEGAVVALFADLVVLNARGPAELAPVVVASRLWQPRLSEKNDATATASVATSELILPTDADAVAWAAETRRALAADSFVAVVRLRRVQGSAGSRLPSVSFAFVVLPPAYPLPLPPPPGRPLRPELALLRAQEGQFGGTTLPADLAALSLAPPQTTAVEPLHFESPPTHQPQPPNGDRPEALDWDWGYSGLRLSHVITRGEIGQTSAPLVAARESAGALQDAWRLSWLATSHPVQFTEQLPLAPQTTTFLPFNFRGAAIRSLLPAPPQVPCPGDRELEHALSAEGLGDSPRTEPWQAELPGGHATYLIGGRPGAYAAMRPHLMTQLASRCDVFEVTPGWQAGDLALIERGGVVLTATVGGDDPQKIAGQAAQAINAAGDRAFADVRAAAAGAQIQLRLVPDAAHDHLRVDAVGADRSTPAGRRVRLHSRVTSGLPTPLAPSMLLSQWRFEGAWAAGDRIAIRDHVQTLECTAPSSDLAEIAAHAANFIQGSQFASLGAVGAAAGGDSLNVWFAVPQIKLRRVIASGGSGSAGSFQAKAQATSTAITTSGSIPVQHRWPRPVHIPANRLAPPPGPAPGDGGGIEAPATAVAVSSRAQTTALAPWGSWFDLQHERNAVEGRGAAAGSLVTIALRCGPIVRLMTAQADANGDWQAAIDWRSLPLGRIEVTASADSSPGISWSPRSLHNYLNRSVDARDNPHDALLVMNGDLAYELDVELLPLASGEPGVVSDRWPPSREVRLQLTTSPHGTKSIWRELGKTLRLRLCSATRSVDFRLKGEESLPVQRFEPGDPDAQAGGAGQAAAALTTMLAEAQHGETLHFELRASTAAVNGIESPPLTARLPVTRVRSSELPLPLQTSFCSFEDPEYSRRLSSPTSRATKSIPPAAGGPADAQAVTLALDRQQYNPTSTFYLLVDAPEAVLLLGLKLKLDIQRIDRAGIKTRVGGALEIPAKQLVDITFASTESHQDNSHKLQGSLSPDDRLEFTLSAKPELVGNVLVDKVLVSHVPVVVAVQIVRESVTPPPEAGYALLRRTTDAPTGAVECVRFAWSPPAQRIELLDPSDLQRESVRRRAVFQWPDAVRPSWRVYYGLQKLAPHGSTLVPPLGPRTSAAEGS